MKTIAMVRKEDAMKTVKDLGATKVIVTGNFKTADNYTKAIMEATDGKQNNLRHNLYVGMLPREANCN